MENRLTIQNELTIQGVLLILKRRQAVILWAVSICLLLGVITCFFLKPRYRATGEIEVQKAATDGVGLENLTNPKGEAQEDSDALDANITLQTQAKILESDSLALKVIDDLNLEHTEDFKPVFNPVGWVLGLFSPAGEKDPPNTALDNAPRRRDHAIGVFGKRLKIKPEAGTRLIHIEYTSTDPKIAAAVVNDMAKSLVDYTLKSRVTATAQVTNWLSGQLGDIKQEAETLQARVEQLQRDSGVYSLGISDAQGKEIAYSATLDRLQQATQALSAATSNRIMKGALYKTVENGDPDLISGLAGSSLAGASPAVSDSFLLLQNLRTQQASLASQIAADRSKYGSANPKLDDDKASLDSINAAISAEIKRIGDRAANDYKGAQSVEDNMRDVYNQERHVADNLNDKSIALLIAQQEATDARTLYQTLFTHLKEAGVIEGLHSSNVSVVDAGRVPSKPRPDILICLALSLFLGCLLGISGALFAEATNDRIEGFETLENTLHASILAILPMTRANASVRALGGMIPHLRWRLTSGDRDTAAGKLAVLDGPNTAYVEALRGLRTSLLFPRSGVSPKTILITSAVEKEGKSTLSLNLAASLVLNGSRVLLVDGDMRIAGLSGYMGFKRQMSSFAVDEKRGLSDALSSHDDPVVVRPFPELSELWVLPAGSATTWPAELLGSQRMRTLVEEWEGNYDYVLIDSPPVLAVSDAVILSRLADTALLVGRHGKSTQKSLERAYHKLHDIEGRDVGIVLNGVHRNSVSFNEFYGYRGTTYYTEA
jgi:polysaccharide biosynthesis transport protein